MSSEDQPLISDNWQPFTDSKFSSKHISPIQRTKRTSGAVPTLANLIKLYVGVAFLSIPYQINRVGVIASAFCFLYIIVQSIFCIYLLLKVRNRFKNTEIIDIVDLGCTLYGEWMRPLLAVLLVATNSSFLMVYIIFYGTQIDQLICKTAEAAECGNHHMYSALVLLALLPLIYIRSLKNIGYFSLFCLVFTLIGIIIIVLLSLAIANETPEDANNEYGTNIKDEDRDFNMVSYDYIPVFAASMNSLYEGNQQILNIYSECSRPQDFFMQSLFTVILLTIVIGCTVGYIGYAAFGSGIKAIILYNLPNQNGWAIAAKIFFIITTCGSFVLVIQPINHVIETSNWYNGRCSDPPKEDRDEDETPGGDDVDPGRSNIEQPQDEESKGFLWWAKFFVVRTTIVVIIFFVAIMIPNISILITIIGAVLGTIINIWLPVIFYNRAYNGKTKNLELIKANQEERANLIAEGADPDTLDLEDPRRWTKVASWFIFVLGTFIGIYGFIYVMIELQDAKPDEV